MHPESFVQRQRRERAQGPSGDAAPFPGISQELLRWLEGIFPPRCYQPGKETLEEHLLYAGASNLVVNLRARNDAPEDGAVEVDILTAHNKDHV